MARDFTLLPPGESPHFKRYLRFISTRGEDRTPTALTVLRSGYEKHHIVPLSLGGPDTLENLIYLTPREHFISHLILWKCYGGPMSRAFWYISHKKGYRGRLTSRQHEALQKTIGIKGRVPWNKGKKGAQSAWNKGITGKIKYPNRKVPVRKALSEETKKKIGVANKGRPSWHKGKKRSEETVEKMKKAWEIRRSTKIISTKEIV